MYSSKVGDEGCVAKKKADQLKWEEKKKKRASHDR
jgi:hypothetical protein